MGDRCRRWPSGLYRDRRHVFAARLPPAHFARHWMVRHRRVQRHDRGLYRDGLGESMIWGAASDRWGPRLVVVTGSALLAASLALASRATSLIEFQILFGLIVGGACAAIFAPMMACVTGWFDTHRSLAVSLVSAGMGMAPMTMSPLAGWLVSIFDWRTSLLIIAALAAAIMIPAALLLRSPPALEDRMPPHLQAKGLICPWGRRSDRLNSSYCC